MAPLRKKNQNCVVCNSKLEGVPTRPPQARRDLPNHTPEMVLMNEGLECLLQAHTLTPEGLNVVVKLDLASGPHAANHPCFRPELADVLLASGRGKTRKRRVGKLLKRLHNRIRGVTTGNREPDFVRVTGEQARPRGTER